MMAPRSGLATVFTPSNLVPGTAQGFSFVLLKKPAFALRSGLVMDARH